MAKEESININFRATKAQKEAMEAKATANGFESLSGYLKYVALNTTVTAVTK
ncbi:hypothetical protein N9X61_01180 [Sulfurimonas sp.]|nr:hypothetical protein [Sulfurimonas sp.]